MFSNRESGSTSRRGILWSLLGALFTGSADAKVSKKKKSALSPTIPANEGSLLQVLVVCLNEKVRARLMRPDISLPKEPLLKGVSQEDFAKVMGIVSDPHNQIAIDKVRVMFAQDILGYGDGGCPTETVLQKIVNGLNS